MAQWPRRGAGDTETDAEEVLRGWIWVPEQGDAQALHLLRPALKRSYAWGEIVFFFFFFLLFPCCLVFVHVAAVRPQLRREGDQHSEFSGFTAGQALAHCAGRFVWFLLLLCSALLRRNNLPTGNRKLFFCLFWLKKKKWFFGGFLFKRRLNILAKEHKKENRTSEKGLAHGSSFLWTFHCKVRLSIQDLSEWPC